MKSTIIALHLYNNHACLCSTADGQAKLACYRLNDIDWPSILSHKRFRIKTSKVTLICHSTFIMHQRIVCEQTITKQQLRQFARCQLQACFGVTADALYFDIATLENQATTHKQTLWLTACQRDAIAPLISSFKQHRLRLHAIWVAEQLMLDFVISSIPHNDAVIIIVSGELILLAYTLNKQVIDIVIHHHISLLANSFNQWPNADSLPRYILSDEDTVDSICQRLCQQYEYSYWLQPHPRYQWHCNV